MVKATKKKGSLDEDLYKFEEELRKALGRVAPSMPGESIQTQIRAQQLVYDCALKLAKERSTGNANFDSYLGVVLHRKIWLSTPFVHKDEMAKLNRVADQLYARVRRTVKKSDDTDVRYEALDILSKSKKKKVEHPFDYPRPKR